MRKRLAGLLLLAVFSSCGVASAPRAGSRSPLPKPSVTDQAVGTSSESTGFASPAPTISWSPDSKYLEAQRRRQTYVDECERRRQAARDRAGAKSAEEWCTDNEPSFGGSPFATTFLTKERVDLAQVLEWWPYRPLLRAEVFPRSIPQESWFADGADAARPGRRSNPKTDRAATILVYSYEPTNPHTSNGSEIQAAGGFILRTEFRPPGSSAPGGYPSEKRVVVRGRPAGMFEFRNQDPRVFGRRIYWPELLLSGGTLSLSIDSSRDVYTEAQALAFVEKLLEVG